MVLSRSIRPNGPRRIVNFWDRFTKLGGNNEYCNEVWPIFWSAYSCVAHGVRSDTDDRDRQQRRYDHDAKAVRPVGESDRKQAELGHPRGECASSESNNGHFYQERSV